MSKHFKKYALLLIAGVVICSMSCKKDSKEGGGEGEVTDFVIEVKDAIILNDNDDNVTTVKAQIWNYQLENYELVATGKYENSEFKLTLPNTVDSSYLYNIRDVLYWSKFNISNPDAKMGEINDFDAYNEDGYRIGLFSYYEVASNKIVCVNYFYADRSVTIKGSYTHWNDYNNSEIRTCDMFLKKGWNVVYIVTEIMNRSYTMTTNRPSNITLEWYYEGWGKSSAATMDSFWKNVFSDESIKI